MNQSIDLPAKILFSEAGVEFLLANQQKLDRIRSAENILEYGKAIPSISPLYLQKLIKLDYIMKIEIGRTEFLSKRQEIIDLNKLIVYSMLYKRFDDRVFTMLLETPFIKQWNRVHPTRIVDAKASFNERYLQDFLVSKQPQFHNAFHLILNPLAAKIQANSELGEEETRTKVLTAQKFLKNLRRFTWFVLLQAENTDGYRSLIEKIQQNLMEHVEKSRISDYLSFIIIELAINAENAKLQKLARQLHRTMDPEQLIVDAQLRDQILNRMQSRSDFLYLTWRIRGSSQFVDKQTILQVNLLNREYEYRTLKAQIENKKRLDVKEKSLVDFYQEIPDADLDNQLGLYYLSYLDDACRQLNMRFDSLVSHIDQDDLTVVALNINFR